MSDPGKCVRCVHQDAVKCYECLPCHYVTLVLGLVHRHWESRELPDLERKLRDSSLRDYVDSARAHNATLSLKLGLTIQRLSFPAKMSADVFKLRVCDAVHGYLKEMEGIQKWEEANNKPGEYMRQWIATVTSWISRVEPKKVERQKEFR